MREKVPRQKVRQADGILNFDLSVIKKTNNSIYSSSIYPSIENSL